MDLKLGLTQGIIQECEKFGVSISQTAYVLATAYWESARTMQPVKEAFWLSETWRAKNLRYYPWYGRGLVQITWKENYAKAGQRLGLDLTTDPNRVLDATTSIRILVRGMVEGWFTGKKLSDYLNNTQRDYVGARRIINGTDRARDIAAIAVKYRELLVQSGYGRRPVARTVR